MPNYPNRAVALYDAIIDGRIACPIPRYWSPFYLKYERMCRAVTPAVIIARPCILSGWGSTNDFEKNEVFKLQLSQLEGCGLLAEALQDLSTYPWEAFHMPENLDPFKKSALELIVDDFEESERLVAIFKGAGIDSAPQVSSPFPNDGIRKPKAPWDK